MPDFQVPMGTDLSRLERSLVERCGLELESVGPESDHRRSVEQTYYDTFDGRLFRAERRLIAESEGREALLRLSGRTADEPGPDVQQRVSSVPRFVWELAPSRLRAELEPLVEMRALLPQVTLRTTTRRYAQRDAARKTVARLALEEHRLVRDGHAASLDARVRVEPLRGYDKAHRRVAQALTKDLGLCAATDDLLSASLAQLGRRLDGYSSKIDVPLAADQRADVAVKEILRQQVDIMEANIDGMCGDVDSEFLHDFRVAIRRSRSAITRMRRVFPQRRVERFKRELRWLGQLSGPARDLDVHLLAFDGMKAHLPTDLGDALEPLRRLLEAHKAAAYAQVIAGVTGRRGGRLLADWRAFVEAGVPARSRLENACRPIGEVAREEIWRSYRKVMRQGRAVAADAPAPQLHELRKACKALRYLMEFFRGLFESEAIQLQIRELKLLQTLLGAVQDLEVRSSSIAGWGRELGAAPQTTPATMMALGALGQQCRSRQETKRRQFRAAFDRFTAKPNRKSARSLFRTGRSRHQP